MAVGGKTVREIAGNVTVVSASEYKKSSRVINKEMYDTFKVRYLKAKFNFTFLKINFKFS